MPNLAKFRSNKAERGNVNILILILLVSGIIGGVYLITAGPLKLLPKAASHPISGPIVQTPKPVPTGTAVASTSASENKKEGSSNNNSGSSNSSSSNSTVNEPLCTDAKPGNGPKLLSAVPDENMVTLTWEKAKDPVTYYLVSYGLKTGEMLYGNPNIGDKNTVSYTVKGLSGGTKYYFKVRAGNNCMPGDFSNELSAKPGGKNMDSIAVGFKKGVLVKSIKVNQISQANDSAGVIERLRAFLLSIFSGAQDKFSAKR